MSTLTGSNSNKQVYFLYHNDGLLEIFAGLMFLMFGIGILAGIPWLGAILPPILWPVWQLFRKKVTLPRLSESDMISEGQIQRQLVMMVIFFTVTAGFGLMVFLFFLGSVTLGLSQWLKEYFIMVLGVLFAGGISATGLILKVTRFQLYAVLSLLVFVTGDLVGLSLPVLMIIMAVLLLIGGLTVLVRFLGQRSN